MQKKTFLEKVKSQPSKRYERSDGNKNINKRTDAQLQKQIQTKAKRTKKKNDEIHHHDSLLVSFVALGRS